MKADFYSQDELEQLELKKFGKNVLLSRKCSLYGNENIYIGENVRIDDFCILSGNIIIGNNVHIAAGTYLYGGSKGITIGDYSTISSRCAVYALSDDYSGNAMVNPMIPDLYKNVSEKPVQIGRHVIIGTGTTILPGVIIGEGCAVGAMSLVNKDLLSWMIFKGIPAKPYKRRMKKMLELEKKFSGSKGGV